MFVILLTSTAADRWVGTTFGRGAQNISVVITSGRNTDAPKIFVNLYTD